MSPTTEPRTALAPGGTLRAAINLGNPVLAQGSPQDPRGVTVALARELGVRLGVPVELLCSAAARDSFSAVAEGRADVGFFAIEPARAEQVAFSAPYHVIEGVYVVADDSPVATPADVDRAGVRVGVKLGSAYDLFLTRTLRHAALVRGEEGVDCYAEQGLDAGAGIRQPATAWARSRPGHRVVEPAFMQIEQAIAVRRDRPDAAVVALDAFVEEMVATGFVADHL